MSKEVIIIGGGIIGLCSAYYLHKEGHHVTVIDQSAMDSGASYVNAGYLSPSHIIPLAAPGVMKKGLKWMFNPTSPLFIKPRLNSDFLRWTWAFNKSCSVKNVNQGIAAIKDIAVLGRDLYSEIRSDENFTFQLEKKGLLMVCQTEKMLEEEIHVGKMATKEGLPVKELSFDELKQMEPNVQLQAKGAVLYECDWHTTPQTFMDEMKAFLEASGVTIRKNEKVEDISIQNNKITSIRTKNTSYTADEFVLAAGSWSNLLSKKLGIKLLLEAGKGYRINTERDLGITMPAILTEAKIAVTPMQGFTRFAGTMEIAGINHKINKVRVETIANATQRYYPDIKLSNAEKEAATSGLRPVSPDGLPYIGKSSTCNNLTIATGHAMMGWTMGTSTGKLVSEIISDQKPSLSLEAYHPDRKF
ncbi:D-amino-acid dehydrogenase [Aquimarina sp. EL_43]|uniref:NAD(P)/FAD-dependent oxidoreductase n=1 Tax=unclassified Aquimarina TaxID=2627091 RepID=UPI0018C92493|nr:MULTISPECIES: FAD-dependent oxidoreductase [unclassified Aquimarina]MBG6130516.1 D-amino-acid dehydrogenase [Aquimarina sp. EL_35]MBG6149296.1 D-amino-acid dehydrogenase [Aquimarina sp. EL_32]MBG6168330.1 D-amino-acid dehydrogenase [Aquimarina sp. EL_43]